MLRLGWKSFINEPLPKIGLITKKTVRRTGENECRFRGSMRVSTKKIWTTSEYEARRKRVLNTPLP